MKQGNEDYITYRALTRDETPKYGEIDRYEIVEDIYYLREGKLVLEKEYYEIKGFDNMENRIKNLTEIFDNGGFLYGAFHSEKLVGLGSLRNKLIGKNNDIIQLSTMHVSANYRKRGIATTIFSALKGKAIEFGGKKMYVTATPSKNTVHFYMGVGFKVTDEPIPELLEQEPDDIHMEIKLL